MNTISPTLVAAKVARYRVRAAQAWIRQVPLRLHFRFGKAVMTQIPVVTLRLSLETERGTLFKGWGASGLPPMWFDKRDGRSLADNEADLLAAVREACAVSLDLGLATPAELHLKIQTETRRRLALFPVPMPPLAAGFGPSVFEAALVDGLCRYHQRSFHALVRDDGLGLGSASPILPAAPTSKLHLRHTVGMIDPLTDADLGVTDRLSDGLPQTLSDVISTYRPSYFKVKIGGGDDATVNRLITLAKLFDAHAGDYRLSLDGNEQWDDAFGFLDLWRRLENEPKLTGFLKRLLYVEQPVKREKSLAPEAAKAVQEIAAKVPLLIDESDGEAGVAEQAFALGYTGISVKLCKSLFRALHHYNLVDARRRQGLPGFLSSEDLTAVAGLPVQQDLALAAALGLTHTERNGHHFAGGGLHLNERERAEALQGLPSLYTPGPEGEPRLRIENGLIDLSEVNARGFGGILIPDTFNQSTLFSLPE